MPPAEVSIKNSYIDINNRYSFKFPYVWDPTIATLYPLMTPFFFQMRGLHGKIPINSSNTSSDNTWNEMKAKLGSSHVPFSKVVTLPPILL